MLPDQAPEAVQLVELLEDQVRVLLPPLVTVVGEALSDSVGAPGPGVVLGGVGLPSDPLPEEDETPVTPQAARKLHRNTYITRWHFVCARCHRQGERIVIAIVSFSASLD